MKDKRHYDSEGILCINGHRQIRHNQHFSFSLKSERATLIGYHMDRCDSYHINDGYIHFVNEFDFYRKGVN